MAIFHLRMISISRGLHRSAVIIAADRAGESLRCERTGIVADGSHRRDVEEKFIVAPAGAKWTQDRARLWNAAEASEFARDARTAREIIVVLPEELTATERLLLLKEFAQALLDRYGAAIDVSIHAPGENDPHGSWCGHLLMTARKIRTEGFGGKTELDLTDRRLRERGLSQGWVHIREIRALWADLANRALARAGHDARIYSREGRGARRRSPRVV